MTDNNLMICLLSPFMAFLIYCLYQLLKDNKSECSICGYKRCKEALEWHHTGGDKEFNVSKFVNSNYPSLKNKEKVLTELSKCVLVCANCHREIHKNVGLE